MPTQKELLEEHRIGLDNEFKQKYPSGRFCLQRRMVGKSFSSNIIPDQPCSYSLHWAPKRNTSHTKYRGISVADRGMYGAIGITHEKYQTSSFGNCKNYDTLDKLLNACQKLDVPQILIDAFIDRYNNRAMEGFNGQ